jgi:hypothetical protein
MNFAQQKDITVADCEAIAKELNELIQKIKEGDLDAFVKFWIEGGTAEGDARINQIQEIIALRFIHRENERNSQQETPKGGE